MTRRKPKSHQTVHVCGSLFQTERGTVAKETHIVFTAASRYLGVGAKTLHEWVKKGKIKPDVVSGNRVLFSVESLDAFKTSQFYDKYMNPIRWHSKMFPLGCRICSRNDVQCKARGMCTKCYDSFPERRDEVPARGLTGAHLRSDNTLLARFAAEGGKLPASDVLTETSEYFDMARRIADLVRDELRGDIKLVVQECIEELLDASTAPSVPAKTPAPNHGRHISVEDLERTM